MDVYTSFFELSAPVAYELFAHSLFSADFTQLGMSVTWRRVFCTHKKKIIGRNKYLVGEATKSSIFNSCQAKIERRSELAGVAICGGATMRHNAED